MFDIGLFELLVVGGVGLIVIGPERLPATIRTGALWFGRIKRSLLATRRELEQQIGADEIRRELRNEEIMAALNQFKEQREKIEQDLKELSSDAIEHETSATDTHTDTAEQNTIHNDAPVHTDVIDADTSDATSETQTDDPPVKVSPAPDDAAQSDDNNKPQT